MKAHWLGWEFFLVVFPVVAQPVITMQPTNQVVIAGSNVTFNVVVAGTGPFTYEWQFGSNNLPSFITTVAGTGTNGYTGDGGAATTAIIYSPSCVVLDSVGNLLIGESGNNLIRKMDTNGIISTVAGNGASGYFGDGGAATNAKLNDPLGLEVDSAGNIFIADVNNNRIRKVNTNGIITTFAGSGSQVFSGNGGYATNAGLALPNSTAEDANGNIFISDSSHSRIRKVDANGIITTVAGNGDIYNLFSGDGGAATNAALSYPWGLAVDKTGNLFFADYSNNRIRKVDTNGIITTVVGNGTQGYSGDGGAATNAELFGPSGVVVDSNGNLFFADDNNNCIRKVDTNGIITTVAGSGTNGYSGDGGVATNAALNFPSDVAVDRNGNLFIADRNNNRIREVQYNSPELILNNISTNEAGNYSVVITGSNGSVTSSVVTLTVLIPTPFTSITAPTMLTNGQFQFSFDTATGVNYAVQYSTNLTQWVPLVTLGGVGVPMILIDPNSAGSPQRFYRIILSPH